MSVIRTLKNLSPIRRRKLHKKWLEQQQVVYRAVEIIKKNKPTEQQGLFIDCGFNTLQVFDPYYEALADQFSFVGFEIQPKLFKKAQDGIQKYQKGQPEFIHAAVADHDGQLNYYEPKSWGLNYKGGSSILREKKDRPSVKIKQSVPCLNFSEWLSERTQKNPFLVVKMDIEGAEYDVLEKLISDQRLDMIDLLFIEFHSQYLTNDEHSDWAQRHANVISALEQSSVQYFDWI